MNIRARLMELERSVFPAPPSKLVEAQQAMRGMIRDHLENPPPPLTPEEEREIEEDPVIRALFSIDADPDRLDPEERRRNKIVLDALHAGTWDQLTPDEQHELLSNTGEPNV